MNNIFKKTFIVISLTVLGLSIASCKEEANPFLEKDAIAIVYQNGVPALIDIDQNLHKLNNYDEVSDEFDDYIIVKKDNLYGFIDRMGHEIIPCKYQKAYPMKEEKAVVKENDSLIIIDKAGNTLYHFKENESSESYFASNMLLVKVDNSFAYLKEENNNFTLSEERYEVAKRFKDGYAVVGVHDKIINYVLDDGGNPTGEIESTTVLDSVKYNYIDTSYNLLLDEYNLEYADDFYEGFAVCGVSGTFDACITKNKNTDPTQYETYEGLIYSYLKTDGTYLHYDYPYTRKEFNHGVLITKNYHLTEQIKLPYANPFNDGLAVAAILGYNSTVKNFTKEYVIITTEGELKYTDAIYADTSYLFGHEDIADYQSKTPGMFWLTKLSKVGSTYAFRVGNTLNGSSWYAKYIAYDYDRERDSFYLAGVILKEESAEELPSWVKSYNDTYLNHTKSTTLVKAAIDYPFEMDDLSYNEKVGATITKIRIIRSTKFGLVAYRTKARFVEYINDYIDDVEGYFIIDPIYDKIVY